MKGDFLGFTFNNVHSSLFGLIRTSESGYKIPLSAENQDITIQLNPEVNCFIRSRAAKKKIIMPLAFKDMPEQKYELLKVYYNNKVVSNLILDEEPYKIYSAKIIGALTSDIIPYSKNGIRVFSGEMVLEFLIFSNYATSRFNYSDYYNQIAIPAWQDQIGQDGVLFFDEKNGSALLVEDDSPLLEESEKQESSNFQLLDIDLAVIKKKSMNYDNKDEWLQASGLERSESYSPFEVKNVGDSPANWSIYFPFDKSIPALTIFWDKSAVLKINEIQKRGIDKDTYFIEFSSLDNVLYGCDKNKKRQNKIYPNIEFYNYYQIPCDNQTHTLTSNVKLNIQLSYNFLYI